MFTKVCMGWWTGYWQLQSKILLEITLKNKYKLDVFLDFNVEIPIKIKNGL